MGAEAQVTGAVNACLVRPAGGPDGPERPADVIACGGAVAFDTGPAGRRESVKQSGGWPDKQKTTAHVCVPCRYPTMDRTRASRMWNPKGHCDTKTAWRGPGGGGSLCDSLRPCDAPMRLAYHRRKIATRRLAAAASTPHDLVRRRDRPEVPAGGRWAWRRRRGGHLPGHLLFPNPDGHLACAVQSDADSRGVLHCRAHLPATLDGEGE